MFITPDIIKELQTKDIAYNHSAVKSFMATYWTPVSNIEKNECVSLGQYTNTKSFSNAKINCYISVRMVLALAIGISPKFNPEYIVGNSNDPTYSDEKIISFIRKHGFSTVADQLTLPQEQSSPVPIDYTLILIKTLEILFRINNDINAHDKLNRINFILLNT